MSGSETPHYEPYRPGGADESETPAPTSAPEIPPDLYGAPQHGSHLDHAISDALGSGSRSRRLPGPDTVARLTPAPRSVPFTFRLAALQLGIVPLFVLFMVSVAPMALWILVPAARIIGLAVVVVGLLVRAIVVVDRRVSLLRWGEVATVTAAAEDYTNTSYSNVPMRRATGWESRTTAYTGQGHRTTLTYELRGVTGTVVVHGAPYEGGVVLADSRRPEVAMCVSQLMFAVKPGDDGRLTGRLTPGAWVGTMITIDLHVAFVILAVLQVRALL